MNVDGSNPVQLSGQSNSENAAWSPDGSQIAYDADGDGDGWQDIWMMDATGANQREWADTPTTDDFLVRSWSPDGRYATYTEVTWEFYQGNWYWLYADLGAVAPDGRISLGGGTRDNWYPDCQTLDATAPESRVLPLPIRSPANFLVQWTASDIGVSGLVQVRVQVRDGATGAWTDWQTSATTGAAAYPGLGGHTYYFRTQAADAARNTESYPVDYDAVTTVEALPPVTAIEPLPAYMRTDTIKLRLLGSDPGGSGIARYDLQVQDNGGAWTDWKTVHGGIPTSETFTGVYGRTYRFRIRGVDAAQNVEPWPAGDGDTGTSLYRWAVSGTVRDSSGSPVADATVMTSPAASGVTTSDLSGVFGAHVAAEASIYTAGASKMNYGSPPTTAFLAATDATLDLVLPPADDAIREGSFETATLLPDWQIGGSLPVTTTTLRHTGNHGAWFGELKPASTLVFIPAANLTNSTAYEGGLQMIPDAGGGVHLFWF